MLSFERLEINNFMSYKHAELDLQDRGTVLILGKNATSSAFTSNGAGKSAIAEAIYWCLFGKTFRDIPSAAVVNNRVEKDCHVTLILNKDGKPWRIERAKASASSSAKLYLCNDPDCGKNSMVWVGDAATRQLSLILDGLTPDQFSNFVFFGRNYRIKLFHEMTDSERKDLFEAVCPDLVTLTQMEEEVKADLDKVDTEIKDRENALRMVTGAISAREEELERTKDTIARDIEQQNKALDAAIQQRDTYAPLAQACKLREPSTDEINADWRNSPEIVEQEKKIRRLSAKISDALATLRQVVSSIKTAETNKVCPTCGRPWDWPKGGCSKEQIAKWEKEKDETEAEISKLRVEVRNIEEVRDKLTAAKSKDAEKKMAAYKAWAKEYNELHSKVSTILTSIKGCEERLARLKSDKRLATIEKALTADKTAKATIETALDGLQQSRTRFVTLKGVLGATGLKSYLLDAIIDKLEFEASKMSSYLSGGELDIQIRPAEKGDFRKREGTLAIRAININGSDVYSGNSSGEKTRVDLCIVFAMIRMAKEMYDVDIRFLFLDEILDTLDDQGVQDVVTLLTKELEPLKGTILLTSHNETLKGLFNKTLTVKKTKGFSEVKRG